MFKVLFILFLVVPIVEISILIQLSGLIGGWTTILVVILTAYLGAKMVKQQGLQTIEKIKLKSASGQIPSEELFSGACILISGVLLLTPGILTDVLGFALLTPMVRHRMIQELKQRIKLFAQGTTANQPFTFTSTEFNREDFTHTEDAVNDISATTDQIGSSARDERSEQDANNVIDGEFHRKD